MAGGGAGRPISPSLGEAYDRDRLRVCELCGLAYPIQIGEDSDQSCCEFDEGALLEWTRRSEIDPMQTLVEAIRARLVHATGESGSDVEDETAPDWHRQPITR